MGFAADGRSLIVSLLPEQGTDVYRIDDPAARAVDGRLDDPRPVLLGHLAQRGVDIRISPDQRWALTMDRTGGILLTELATGRELADRSRLGDDLGSQRLADQADVPERDERTEAGQQDRLPDPAWVTAARRRGAVQDVPQVEQEHQERRADQARDAHRPDRGRPDRDRHPVVSADQRASRRLVARSAAAR